MTSLYRKALELVGKAWTYLRLYAYMRGLFDKDNPEDVHRAVIAAYAGREVAKWAQAHPDEILSNAWRNVPTEGYQPFRQYSNEELPAIFPFVVDGPYDLDILTNIHGVNETGFQRFRIQVDENDTWNDIYSALLKRIGEFYEYSGKITEDTVANFIIGYIRP